MSKRLYTATERYLGEEIKQQLVVAMAETAKEEREHAIVNDTFHQGIPAIKVTVDRGWSKRSHKHSYNAKSGVAVIFGNYTKKLLFLGVRNKFCSVCAVAENKGQEPPSHTCYKNWNGSSPAMETDILCEGFQLSESQYGIRYLYVVGDGDSSVMANIRQLVSYGIFVQKLECANHAFKCYRSRLEAIVKDFPHYKGRGGLTQMAIRRLTIGARIAIRENSKTRDILLLRHDLRNGPAHVFREHTHCSPSFCKYSQQSPSVDNSDVADSSPGPSDSVDTSFLSQVE